MSTIKEDWRDSSNPKIEKEYRNRRQTYCWIQIQWFFW